MTELIMLKKINNPHFILNFLPSYGIQWISDNNDQGYMFSSIDVNGVCGINGSVLDNCTYTVQWTSTDSSAVVYRIPCSYDRLYIDTTRRNMNSRTLEARLVPKG